jgi:4-aminobutyrate aminotransferase-like enzyme
MQRPAAAACSSRAAVTGQTYLAQLGGPAHVVLQPLEEAAVVSQIGAVGAPTATSRARNAASTACFHRVQGSGRGAACAVQPPHDAARKKDAWCDAAASAALCMLGGCEGAVARS